MKRANSFRAARSPGTWTQSIALLGGIFCTCVLLPAQPQASTPLDETGLIALAGKSAPYRIRRLPVSSFPDLPAAFQKQLNQLGCLIPQTYEAHAPENVVHASLERPGSSDWAVLCSVQGTVSLLVFFGSAPEQLQTLATAPESQRLQKHGASGVLGFDWGIDPATPERIHEAQTGLTPRPMRIDHDALADSIIDRPAVYHFYSKNGWILLRVPE